MKNKTKMICLCFFGVIIIIFSVCIIYFGVSFSKANNFVLYQPKIQDYENKEIYILGTIHSSHFNKNYNYSMKHIKSVIDTVNPDIILIEIRQEILNKYNVLDGPIEMIFAWCYANEKNIEVKGIDYWEISNEFKPNTTDTNRDDNIFNNIITEMGNNGRTLVLCGRTHRIELDKRFKQNDYIKVGIRDKNRYFNINANQDFYYPQKMAKEIEKKINYFQSDFIDEINSNIPSDSNNYLIWINQTENLINSLSIQLTEIIIPNKLYN
jgi:hypothetical protein